MIEWLRRRLWWHRWHYRSAYDRVCEVCGRWETGYTRQLLSVKRSEWDVIDGGDESLHYKPLSDRKTA